MRKLFLSVSAIVALLLLAASFYYGKLIPFAQQWPLFEALRNTAAIIFAVVGAWLAIIYPERLKFSFGATENRRQSGSNIGLLLTPAVHSTIILVVLLLVGIVAPLLKQVPAIAPYIVTFRGLSFLLLSGLTIWQIIIVVMTIFPAELIKTATDREHAIKSTNDHYEKLVRREG